MLVLVEDAAEAVPSADVEPGGGVRPGDRWGQWAQRPGVGDSLVRPVGVAGLLELAQGMQQVRLVPDQHEGDRLQQLRAVLPCEVQVTSRAHPLFGQRLKASRFSRRGGALNLVVELPDGAPGMIRADATDVLGTVNAEGLAVVMDAEGLRHLRDLVGALGRKTAGVAGGTAGAGR